MLEEILSSLREQYLQNAKAGVWRLEVTDGALARFFETARFKKNLERYETNNYRAEETGGLFEGTKAVAVYGDDHWAVGLSRSDNVAPYVFSKPAPFIFGPVQANSPVKIDLFHIDSDLDLIAAKSGRVVFVETIELDVNQFWSAPSANITFSIQHTQDRPVMFRIVSKPPKFAYMHAYSRETGDYVYSSFASNDHTSFDFVAKLAKALALDEGFRGSLDDEDRENFKLLLREMDKQDAAPTSRWLVLQALGRFDRHAAREKLHRFANGADPILSNAARKALGDAGQ